MTIVDMIDRQWLIESKVCSDRQTERERLRENVQQTFIEEEIEKENLELPPVFRRFLEQSVDQITLEPC